MRPQVYDLAHSLNTHIPCSPNHPGFKIALLRRHGDHVRSDGTTGANEMFVTGSHVGTHIDALCHVAHEDTLYGGHSASEAQSSGLFTVHGAETIEPIVEVGVLLDMPRHFGVRGLEPGQGISADDVRQAAFSQGVDLMSAGVILIRTGWSEHFGNSAAFVGLETGVPGLDASAADLFVELNVRAVGSDTIAFEQILPGLGHALLPVHKRLIVDAGVHILEVLHLETLASARLTRFAFVAASIKIVGATGAPVRPLAWDLGSPMFNQSRSDFEAMKKPVL